MVEDAGGLRRSPDQVRLPFSLERAPKERIEPTYVVHVQMREEEVIDGLNLTEAELRDAAFTTIEEQALDRLTGVYLDQNGVLLPAAPRMRH